MQMPEGPQVHTARARTHTHGSSQHLMQSAANLRPSPSQGSLSYAPPPGTPTRSPSYAAPTQTNSFVPQPASPMSRTNSYVPPLHSSSYNVPVSSPMVTAAPQAELEPQYPNSVERVRDLGAALCNNLMAPPPRMLSFENTAASSFAIGLNAMASSFAVNHAAPNAHVPPRRMPSCDRIQNSSSFLPLPLPMQFPYCQSHMEPPCVPDSTPGMSPLRQHANSYAVPTGTPFMH